MKHFVFALRAGTSDIKQKGGDLSDEQHYRNVQRIEKLS